MIEGFRQQEHRENDLRTGRRGPGAAEATLAGKLFVGKQHGAIRNVGGLHQVGIGGAGLFHEIDGGEIIGQCGANAFQIKCSHKP